MNSSAVAFPTFVSDVPSESAEPLRKSCPPLGRPIIDRCVPLLDELPPLRRDDAAAGGDALGGDLRAVISCGVFRTELILLGASSDKILF